MSFCSRAAFVTYVALVTPAGKYWLVCSAETANQFSHIIIQLIFPLLLREKFSFFSRKELRKGIPFLLPGHAAQVTPVGKYCRVLCVQQERQLNFLTHSSRVTFAVLTTNYSDKNKSSFSRISTAKGIVCDTSRKYLTRLCDRNVDQLCPYLSTFLHQ